MAESRICTFPGCGRKHKGHGLCDTHLQQKRSGKDLFPVYDRCRPDGAPPRIRYDEVVCLREGLKGPCHVFRGAKQKDGYGNVRANGKKLYLAHRYVWEQKNGTIPEGLEIDHQCKNRACCNVDHLRLVAHRVNCTENSDSPGAILARNKMCIRGHMLDNELATYITGNRRRCRVCERERGKRRYAAGDSAYHRMKKAKESG